MSNTAINPSLGMRITLAAIAKRFSLVEQMSTDEFFELWSKEHQTSVEEKRSWPKLLVLDVRAKEERDISFLKGSIWVDSTLSGDLQVKIAKSKIEEKINEDADVELDNSNKALEVIAYCSIGYRSSDLVKQMLESDILSSLPSGVEMKLYNLDGSLFKWANEGKPIIDSNNEPTCFVHPYNSLWGKLLNEKFRKSSL